jgi:hypothetical protein
MLVLAIVVTIFGSLVPLNAQDAKQISDTINQTRNEGLANGNLIPSILLNNFGLCLAMFIPVAGAFFGLFVLFSTGIAIGAEIQVQRATAASAPILNISPTTAIVGLIVFVLVFLLEYLSYSIAIAESIWLYRRLRQRQWKELKNATKFIGIVAVFLIVGAVIETWLIMIIG